MSRATLCAQQVKHRLATRVAQFRPAHHQVQQIVVLVFKQFPEIFQLLRIQHFQVTAEKIGQHQVQLQQTAPTMPAYAVEFAHERRRLHHRLRPGGTDHPADCLRPDDIRPAVDPPAGAPRRVAHTVRLTSMSLILPMARVGLSPLGQTSTQFMIEWQRNRRYGSSRLSSRSPVAWSRVSARKR
jgi:hypothetical protein